MLRVKTVDGCSLAFHRGRKYTLPMGTARTGPESLKISVAIGLPSFLPSCPVTCCKLADNKFRKPSREEGERERGREREREKEGKRAR